MAVKFKTYAPTDGPDQATLSYLSGKVRKLMGIAPTPQIRVGFSVTEIMHNGVTITLPFGIPLLKSEKAAEYSALKSAREALHYMQCLDDHKPGTATPDSHVAPDDMTDQQWVEHTAKKLFPGTIHLYQAQELYQPVLGTSSGSIYKTCFIGPDLKIAARLKGNSVSFRVTTASNKAPEGQVRTVLKRIGEPTEYEDRLTMHSGMQGAYNETYAHEYRALFGAFYAALKPWITSDFPAIGKLAQGVK